MVSSPISSTEKVRSGVWSPKARWGGRGPEDPAHFTIDVVTIVLYDDHMDVGIRELKAKLSDYVGRVAAGESVTVTDRGRPVARLVPFEADAGLERGIEEGWVEAPRRTHLDPVERVRAVGCVLDVLDDDRG